MQRGQEECSSLLIAGSLLDPPLQLFAGVAAHCLCSLSPHARVGLLGACEDGEAGI